MIGHNPNSFFAGFVIYNISHIVDNNQKYEIWKASPESGFAL